MRDAIIGAFNKEPVKEKTINIIKNDYVSEYLYETLLDGINDSYPLLEYIKYTYEPNKFADYINTLDILNPPV